MLNLVYKNLRVSRVEYDSETREDNEVQVFPMERSDINWYFEALSEYGFEQIWETFLGDFLSDKDLTEEEREMFRKLKDRRKANR